MKHLRKVFEREKGYSSWNCNDTVIMEYIEWLEEGLANQQPTKKGESKKYQTDQDK